MQERLKRILVSLGFVDGALHCAANIAQGKAIAGAARFALALVDLGLPAGRGIDPFIARRILGLSGEPASAGAKPPPNPDIELRDSLSERELAILSRVAQGMSNREIAEAVNLSRWTVDTHIRHIYGKLAVNSRTQ